MKILLAEDDVMLVDLLRFLFEREHFQVFAAFDGEEALREFRFRDPDVVLLDLKMPRRSGQEVLKQIRESCETPVIVLSATDDEDTKVKLFRLGADDYVVKPFQPRELLARVEAKVRHNKIARVYQDKPQEPMTCGAIQLDPLRHRVVVGDTVTALTDHEYRVLELLMLNKSYVLSMDEILDRVWGYTSDVTRDVVRVTIGRLRRKVEANPSAPQYVVNVPGGGYMITDEW